MIECLKPYSMSIELNINVNLLESKRSDCNDFDLGIVNGGGNIGSTAILNAFYIMLGIIRAKSGLESYKQGLLLT